MSLFIKIVGMIIYFIVAFLILKNNDDIGLMFLIILSPVYIRIIIDYFEYLKTISLNKHILLNKSSNHRYHNVIFYVLGLFFSAIYINYYSLAFIVIILITGYFDYLQTKRRAIIIDKEGVRDVIEDKKRELSEITLFEIHPNNIEIRFSKVEILQLNKNEILSPSWEELVTQMKKLKIDHNIEVF